MENCLKIEKEENAFAFLLYKAISSNEKNIILCPVSINIILTLIYTGANDETASEIDNLLKLNSLDKSHIAHSYEIWHKMFDNLNEISFKIINKIYIKNDYELLDSFKTTAIQFFRTEIESISFMDTDNALSEINSWISDITNQRIRSVIDAVCTDDIMILINTIYFNALWENEFQINKYPIEFHITENEIVEVSHLFRKDLYNYYNDPELKVKVLEIPYKNGNFSFVIFLPNTINGWKDVEKYLPSFNFQNKLEENLVKVSIPMFKIEQTHNLTNILQELGMKTAFNNCANLNGMAKSNQEPLKISQIIQKNSIIISEKGTEVSTASAGLIKMKLSSSEVFNADRPFFFMIQYKPTNSILYLGRVINPKM